jgi:hypothetical protein
VANRSVIPDKTRRWDTDERGRGVADATAILPRIEALAEHATRPDWVTEDATAHLWPHFERAIAAEGSPWRAAHHDVDGEGRLVIELEHVGADERLRAEGRADAFALIGQVAEATTFVRVADPDDGAATADRSLVVIDVVTGMLDDETAFLSHGHTIRLRITATSAR